MDPTLTLPPEPTPGQRTPLTPEVMDGLGMPPLPDPFAPKYPSWLYTTVTRKDPFGGETAVRELAPPKEPEPGQFRDWISGDALLYGELLRRFRMDLRTYRQLDLGVGRQFDPDVDAAYFSGEATIQVNKVAAMGSGAPITIRYPWRTVAEREKAAAMEAFARWFLEQWAIHHAAGGHADLKWDMFWYSLIYGRVAIHVGGDLDDGDFPWWVELLDPATCFPIFGKGKRGMLRMTRRFTASTGDILDEFDPTGADGLADKLAAAGERKGQNVNDLDLTEDRTVEQCTTRWHRFTEVDGVEIELVAHEYGFVPYSYRVVTGEAGSAAAPGNDTTGTGLSATDIKRRGYGSEAGSSRQRDLAEKGQSFYHPIRHALRQREKVLGMSMIAVEQAINPAIEEKTANPRGMAPTDLSPGKRNTSLPNESRAPIIPAPRPFDASTLLGELNTELRKGLLPDVIFGQTEGSNITGFASDSLIAAAKDRIQPYFTVVPEAMADAVSMAALLFRNFGWAAEGLPDGVLIIPRTNRGGSFLSGAKPAPTPEWVSAIVQKLVTAVSTGITPALPPGAMGQPPGTTPGMGAPGNGMMPPGMGAPGGIDLIGMPGVTRPEWTMRGLPAEDAPEVRIDRETIDAVAARPKISLETLGLNNRTVLINYLTQAVNAKLMRRATAMDQLPEIDDPLAEWQGIVAEDAFTDPEMLRRIHYPRALWQEGDLEAWATYWAVVLLPEILAAMQPMLPNQGAPPGAPPPTPNGRGQAPIPQPAPARGAVGGQNPAALGQGPGSQGQPVGNPGYRT